MKKQGELDLLGEGVPETTIESAKRIMRLMEPVTSLSVVAEFLKSKKLHYSAASWADLRDKRIIPALRRKKIVLSDLAQLLNEAEEFGKCHVFLFTATKSDAERCMDPRQIERACARLGVTHALRDLIVEDLPESPTITQIRREEKDGRSAWVFKIVEKREEKTFVGETTDGDRFRKEWKIGFVRAVNVLKLHDSGLLEMRIQSHISSSRYEADINRVWNMVRDFLPPNKFVEHSLRKAKNRMWDKRDELKKKIRFSDSTMRNDIGNTIIASTGSETADLFEDSSIGPSLDQFLQHGGHCDSSNIWFRPCDGVMSREIHVLLYGRNNEFAVTATCARNEYEYVLNELRAHNK